MSDLCSVRYVVLLIAVLCFFPYCSYLLSLISYLLSLISYLLSLYPFLESFVAELGACESDEVQVIPPRRHSNYGWGVYAVKYINKRARKALWREFVCWNIKRCVANRKACISLLERVWWWGNDEAKKRECRDKIKATWKAAFIRKP